MKPLSDIMSEIMQPILFDAYLRQDAAQSTTFEEWKKQNNYETKEEEK